MMLAPPTLTQLFAQLGLASDAANIKQFIHQHAVPVGVLLASADFWTQGQAQFLQEALDEDADWAEIIDQLDTMLRK